MTACEVLSKHETALLHAVGQSSSVLGSLAVVDGSRKLMCLTGTRFSRPSSNPDHSGKLLLSRRL